MPEIPEEWDDTESVRERLLALFGGPTARKPPLEMAYAPVELRALKFLAAEDWNLTPRLRRTHEGKMAFGRAYDQALAEKRLVSEADVDTVLAERFSGAPGWEEY